MTQKCDYLIIGAGIIGVNIARAIKNKYPRASVILIDKEDELALHSSGRNSGVLHAGFYYKADSLKAKFTRRGNQLITEYCEKNNLQINKCGKVVVTQNEHELDTLMELFKRGQTNNSDVILVDAKELGEIEPCALTYKKAIYSPHTSTVNPKQVLLHMVNALKTLDGVKFITGAGYSARVDDHNTILTTKNERIEAGFIINTAGAHCQLRCDIFL